MHPIGRCSKRIKMPAADASSNLSRNDGRSFGVPSPLNHGYFSPTPEKSISGGKASYSPPPPPRRYARSVDDVEPDAEAMLLELNSGRSLLHAQPAHISSTNLPRTAFFKITCDCISHDIYLTPPSSPSFPGGGISEEGDDDTPLMFFPIRLRMRRTGARYPVAPRINNRFLDHSFIPTQVDNDDADVDIRNSERSP